MTERKSDPKADRHQAPTSAIAAVEHRLESPLLRDPLLYFIGAMCRGDSDTAAKDFGLKPETILEGPTKKHGKVKWSDRYLLLDRYRLLIYRSAESRRTPHCPPINVIFLPSAQLTAAAAHSLTITTPSRKYELAFASKGERDAWISSIQKEMKFVKKERHEYIINTDNISTSVPSSPVQLPAFLNTPSQPSSLVAASNSSQSPITSQRSTVFNSVKHSASHDKLSEDFYSVSASSPSISPKGGGGVGGFSSVTVGTPPPARVSTDGYNSVPLVRSSPTITPTLFTPPNASIKPPSSKSALTAALVAQKEKSPNSHTNAPLNSITPSNKSVPPPRAPSSSIVNDNHQRISTSMHSSRISQDDIPPPPPPIDDDDYPEDLPPRTRTPTTSSPLPPSTPPPHHNKSSSSSVMNVNSWSRRSNASPLPDFLPPPPPLEDDGPHSRQPSGVMTFHSRPPSQELFSHSPNASIDTNLAGSPPQMKSHLAPPPSHHTPTSPPPKSPPSTTVDDLPPPPPDDEPVDEEDDDDSDEEVLVRRADADVDDDLPPPPDGYSSFVKDIPSITQTPPTITPKPPSTTFSPPIYAPVSVSAPVSAPIPSPITTPAPSTASSLTVTSTPSSTTTSPAPFSSPSASIRMNLFIENGATPIGFLLCPIDSVMSSLRDRMVEELDEIPSDYLFLLDGIPVGRRQEGKTTLSTFITASPPPSSIAIYIRVLKKEEEIKEPITVPSSRSSSFTVYLKGVDEALGVLEVDNSDQCTLEQLRNQMMDELDDLPDDFVFLQNDAPIGRRQEGKKTAASAATKNGALYIRLPKSRSTTSDSAAPDITPPIAPEAPAAPPVYPADTPSAPAAPLAPDAPPLESSPSSTGGDSLIEAIKRAKEQRMLKESRATSPKPVARSSNDLMASLSQALANRRSNINASATSSKPAPKPTVTVHQDVVWE